MGWTCQRKTGSRRMKKGGAEHDADQPNFIHSLVHSDLLRSSYLCRKCAECAAEHSAKKRCSRSAAADGWNMERPAAYVAGLRHETCRPAAGGSTPPFG